MLFGLVGTIICFVMFSLLTMGFNELGIFTRYTEHGEESFKLNAFEILMFCSLMCSSDVIAAVSIVSYEEQPKLYSIVFGEGITNDAVSIILFNAIS